MELLRLLSTNEIVAQAVSFLLLVFLLRLFVWKRFLGILDRRRDRIASEFKNIEDAKAQASKLKADYESRLASIEDKARQVTQDAVVQGRRVIEEVRKQAHQQAQAIIEKAREDLRYELVKAKEELKDEIVNLTIAAAEEVVQQKLTGENEKKLIRDFLEKVDRIDDR